MKCWRCPVLAALPKEKNVLDIVFDDAARLIRLPVKAGVRNGATRQKRFIKPKRNGHSPQWNLFENGSSKRARRTPTLPTEDNTPEGLRALLEANAHYREVQWPEPYDRTTHRLHLGDARNLSWIGDESVHLVVTSPPYWTLKQYAPGNEDQMGLSKTTGDSSMNWIASGANARGSWLEAVESVASLETFAFRENGARHYLVPLRADIQVRAREFGLDCLQPILWNKIANGATEAEGNGAGFDLFEPIVPSNATPSHISFILFFSSAVATWPRGESGPAEGRIAPNYAT